MTPSDPRRDIPAVGRLLGDPAFHALIEEHSKPLVVSTLRDLLDDLRDTLEPDAATSALDPGNLANELRTRLEEGVAPRAPSDPGPSLRPVINATGVILHTNLGRAPLPRDAIAAMEEIGAGYSNLEYDLDEGSRGSRYDHCRELVARLTGAEDALVVNNNAAALVLAVSTFAQNREVVVSRGEIVEIGGGFRIPEMLERAGARLREVGTTNRTRLSDYERALETGDVGLILKVHRSNFEIRGFTEETSVDELAALARNVSVPLLYDLGSGLLTNPIDALSTEPTPGDGVRSGADLVAFSGDKLLGGPQAGLLVGSAERIAAARENPLCRALRVDKVTLAALHATLRIHLLHEERGIPADREIPALRMLTLSEDELRDRVHRWLERLDGVEGVAATPCESVVGGGCSPSVRLPSAGLRLESKGAPEALSERLRQGDPPVVARIESDGVVLDARTVAEEADDHVVEAVRRALLDEAST